MERVEGLNCQATQTGPYAAGGMKAAVHVAKRNEASSERGHAGSLFATCCTPSDQSVSAATRQLIADVSISGPQSEIVMGAVGVLPER